MSLRFNDSSTIELKLWIFTITVNCTLYNNLMRQNCYSQFKDQRNDNHKNEIILLSWDIGNIEKPKKKRV